MPRVWIGFSDREACHDNWYNLSKCWSVSFPFTLLSSHGRSLLELSLPKIIPLSNSKPNSHCKSLASAACRNQFAQISHQQVPPGTSWETFPLLKENGNSKGIVGLLSLVPSLCYFEQEQEETLSRTAASNFLKSNLWFVLLEVWTYCLHFRPCSAMYKVVP